MLNIQSLINHRREASLFCPKRGKNQDLLRLYPELTKVKEFKKLSPDEVLFAWYYAIYFGKAQSGVRLESSMDFAFYGKLSPEQEADYRNLKFSEEVAGAINKFQTYNLDIRTETKFMDQAMLQNWKRITMIDVMSLEDWDEKKKYVDVSRTIMNEIPALVARIEEGYGVRETEFLSEEQENLISEYMNKKDNQ